MNQTHYEKILGSGLFPTEQLFDILRKDIPSEGFTFEQFADTSIVQDMADSVTSRNEADMNSVVQMLFHLYSYHIGMSRTYEVTEELGEMLLNTKLDVDVRMVKSPFTEIQIVVPPLLQLCNRYTGMHDISTIYVNYLEIAEDNKLLKFLCVGRPNKESINEFDDALFYFKVPLTPGKVSESLKHEIDEWRVDPHFGKFSADAEHDIGLMPRLYQFILNVLLYITSSNSDVRLEKSRLDELQRKLEGLKSPSKKRKLSKRISKESSLHRYVVGSGISLSEEERQVYQAIKRGSPKVRFKVGGHWRMQWVGKRGSQVQKPTWVRPHFKGPEVADLVQSIGVLK